MLTRRLIILLSLLLAIAPVTVAYSALLVDQEPEQAAAAPQTLSVFNGRIEFKEVSYTYPGSKRQER
jgi:hypothetical protein